MSPINDPGNAGTASENWPEPRLVEKPEPVDRTPHAGQRVMTALVGITTALTVLVAGFGVLTTGDWDWAVGALIGWVAGLLAAASITYAMYGPNKKNQE